MKRWEIYLEIVLEILIFVAILVAIGYGLPRLLAFLWPLVAGWVIALMANPIRVFLEKKIRLSKKFGSALIVIVVIAIVAFGLYFLAMFLVREAVSLGQSIPEIYKSVTESIRNAWVSITASAKLISPGVAQTVGDVGNTLKDEIGKMISKVGTENVGSIGVFAKGITNGLIGIIVTFMSAYFFLVDKEYFSRLWKKIDAPEFHKKIKVIKTNILSALGGYVIAQIKIMVIVMVVLFIGFLILHVNYSFLLALLIAILDAIPFLGTGTALIPWALYEMINKEFGYGVGLLVIYVICLLLRQILQPKIVGDTVGLSPLMTLVLMYVGMKVAGILGFIIAIVLGIIVKRLHQIGMFDGLLRRVKLRFEMLKDAP